MRTFSTRYLIIGSIMVVLFLNMMPSQIQTNWQYLTLWPPVEGGFDSTRLESHDICSGGSVPSDMTDIGNHRTIGLVVADSIFDSITSSLEQYVQDLQNTGYQTIIYSDHLQTVQDLRLLITDWYQSHNLIGVLLIGRLPYAQFYLPASPQFESEVFICDLYLMDLDGSWWDLNGDGIFDKHNASTGTDIHPEIFVGRIDPSALTWTEDQAKQIEEYLTKLHIYRTGGLQRSDRALVFVDNDWSTPWGTMWNHEIGLAYLNRTLVNDPDMTRASSWLKYITEDYQWAHLCAHSSPTTHYFGPGGRGQGTVSSSEIQEVSPSISFYNLFCCSGADWTVEDNLAVTYIFGSNQSLAVVGSAKTGSMMDLSHFYQSLGMNRTLGESLFDWFSAALNPDGQAGEDYRHWYYGMNIVGDPMLTIKYDCTAISPEISSPTHPNQSRWYNNAMPVFELIEPPEVNEINGYYYVIDRNPTTMPSIEDAIFTTGNIVQASSPLSDGTWFIHVITEDSVGNRAANATHYRVNIDQTPPTVTIISHPPSALTPVNSITLQWTVQDLLSGYNHSQVWIDDYVNPWYEGLNRTVTIKGLEEREHVINITAFDKAGNAANAVMAVLVDLTNPRIISVQPINGSLVGSTAYLSWTIEETGSGYSHAVLILDDDDPIRIEGPETNAIFTNLEIGEHVVKLTVYDRVNRSDTIQLRLYVHPIMNIPWTLFISAIAVIAVGAAWVHSRKE